MSPGLDVSKIKSPMSLRRVQRAVNGDLHNVQNYQTKRNDAYNTFNSTDNLRA